MLSSCLIYFTISLALDFEIVNIYFIKSAISESLTYKFLFKISAKCLASMFLDNFSFSLNIKL
jgi:hypothetical protein